jgi:hypothetical protein
MDGMLKNRQGSDRPCIHGESRVSQLNYTVWQGLYFRGIHGSVGSDLSVNYDTLPTTNRDTRVENRRSQTD